MMAISPENKIELCIFQEVVYEFNPDKVWTRRLEPPSITEMAQMLKTHLHDVMKAFSKRLDILLQEPSRNLEKANIKALFKFNFKFKNTICSFAFIPHLLPEVDYDY